MFDDVDVQFILRVVTVYQLFLYFNSIKIKMTPGISFSASQVVARHEDLLAQATGIESLEGKLANRSIYGT